jgi:hypothetical protein
VATKVAATVCEPARTGNRTVSSPSSSDVMPPLKPMRVYVHVCTRVPSTLNSSVSLGMNVPMPRLRMVKTYSPSAGNTWLTARPPRVPKGCPGS